MKKKPQNPEGRRLIITLVVVLVAIGIVLAVMFGGPGSQTTTEAEIETMPTESATTQADAAKSPPHRAQKQLKLMLPSRPPHRAQQRLKLILPSRLPHRPQRRQPVPRRKMLRMQRARNLQTM